MYVRLAKDWTDGNGSTYSAGDTVEVDAGTLAELEATGIVADTSGDGTTWPGPTGGEDPDWPGPTGGDGTTWPGPTGGDTT